MLESNSMHIISICYLYTLTLTPTHSDYLDFRNTHSLRDHCLVNSLGPDYILHDFDTLLEQVEYCRTGIADLPAAGCQSYALHQPGGGRRRRKSAGTTVWLGYWREELPV